MVGLRLEEAVWGLGFEVPRTSGYRCCTRDGIREGRSAASRGTVDKRVVRRIKFVSGSPCTLNPIP